MSNVIIPEHELEITISRAGGPGGQHVNKSDTRVTIHWNVQDSGVLSNDQKVRILQKLAPSLTSDGDFVVHCAISRSQTENKKRAIEVLHQRINKALYVPKKRMTTRVPAGVKEKRLEQKKQRGEIKKTRKIKSLDD